METIKIWIVILYTIGVVCGGFQVLSPFFVILHHGDTEEYFGFYFRCYMVNDVISDCHFHLDAPLELSFVKTIRILFSISLLLKVTILLTMIAKVVLYLGEAERKICAYHVPFMFMMIVVDIFVYSFYSGHNREFLYYSHIGFYVGLMGVGLILLTVVALMVDIIPVLLRERRGLVKMHQHYDT